MTVEILKKRKHDELNSVFSEFAHRRAESGFRLLEKKKSTLILLVSRQLSAVGELAYKKLLSRHKI